MGANIDKSINQGNGPCVFRTNGQVHHHIGSLLPKPNETPQFAQLYIYDTENEIANRIRAVNKEDPESADLDPEIVDSLIKMLDQYNPIVKEFRHARDILREHEGVDVSIRIVGTDGQELTEREMPNINELAILIVGELSLENYKRDIIVQSKTHGLQHISILHPAYMPLQYPLLFIRIP